MNTIHADTFFQTVKPSTVKRYNDYWHSVRPKTQEDIFRRYLFAFTSVHTTWQGNVRGYNAIKNLDWLKEKETLRSHLISAKCGMFNNRTDYIWKFKDQFFGNLDLFCKPTGNWTEYRNRLVKEINGLGIAKVSFTLEMCFPLEARVSCIDTHGITLYEIPTLDFKSKKGIDIYQNAEQHWLESSDEVNAPSYTARCIFWDRKQKRRNPRYWSYVLEN